MLFCVYAGESSEPVPPVTPVISSASLAVSSLKTHVLATITGGKRLPPSAVFQRGKKWTVIWSEPLDIEIPDNFKGVESIDFEQQEGMTTLTFELSTPLPVVVDTTPNTVELKFGLMDEQHAGSSTQIILPEKEEDSIRIPYAEGKEILEYIDADNQTYWVVPTKSKNKVSFDYYDFVDGEILESAYGLVVHSHRPDLLFEANDDTVFISIEGGDLSVSTHAQVSKIQKPILMPSLFDQFDAIKAQRRREEIDELIKNKPIMTIIPQVLEQAWLHIGLGNMPEALASIRTTLVYRPYMNDHPYIKALLGIVDLLLHKYEESTTALKLFTFQPETEFWLTLSQALSAPAEKQGDHLKKMLGMESVLLNLPRIIREKLLVLILSAGCAVKNKDLLEQFAVTKFAPKDPSRKAIYDLAKAMLFFINDNPSKGIPRIEELMKQRANAQVAVMAEFELLQYKLSLNTMTYDQAVAALDKLRFKWRGDQLEYRVTRFLAHLYWKNKNYPKALKLYRFLIEYFPDDSQADRLPELMQEGVLLYFRLTPQPSIMEALSFFQEFADVAPDTIEGDNVIIEATNRLVDIKLTSESIRLLRQYMKRKIKKGDDQTLRTLRFIYHIATLELKQDKPDNAVKDLLSVKEWPDSLKEDAHQLLCQALIEAQRYDEAFAQLDSSPRDQAILGSLYMSQKEWAKAIETFNKTLDHLPADFSLDKKADMIVNLAVSLNMANDKEALKKLDEKYTDFMVTQKQRDLFTFLVSDITKDLDMLDAATLLKIEKTTDLLKKVLK